MGVPVSPRNIFPSNIQGMPTWYECECRQRATWATWQLRLDGGVNPQTWDADVRKSRLAATCSTTYPARGRVQVPADLNVIACRSRRSATEVYTADVRPAPLFKNIVYVGALSALLDIEARRDGKAVFPNSTRARKNCTTRTSRPCT